MGTGVRLCAGDLETASVRNGCCRWTCESLSGGTGRAPAAGHSAAGRRAHPARYSSECSTVPGGERAIWKIGSSCPSAGKKYTQQAGSKSSSEDRSRAFPTFERVLRGERRSSEGGRSELRRGKVGAPKGEGRSSEGGRSELGREKGWFGRPPFLLRQWNRIDWNRFKDNSPINRGHKRHKRNAKKGKGIYPQNLEIYTYMCQSA